MRDFFVRFLLETAAIFLVLARRVEGCGMTELLESYRFGLVVEFRESEVSG